MPLWERIKQRKDLVFKLLALFSISFLYLGRSLNDFEQPYVYGDGFEYVLMTEAFSNHHSPDIRYTDVDSYLAKCAKRYKMEEFSKKEFFPDLSNYLKKSKNEFKESIFGFYCDKNQKWYSLHFWFYSFINWPVYSALSHKYGPIRPFYVTNAVFVIITCLILLFCLPFGLWRSVLATLCFCFCSNYWYLAWEHSEIYTMCLVALGLMFLFRKQYYWALGLLALASLQNQPLILLVGFVALMAFLEQEKNLKTISKICLLSAVALIPSFFFYVHFNTTNLVKEVGFLDTKYVTLNRVKGFFFDLNQGMILTIPLILLSWIALWLFNIKEWLVYKKRDLLLLLPFVVLGITLSVATMGNWNHACAIINRYASWVSIIVMMHAFYMTNHLENVKSIVLFNYFFVTQTVTTLYHQQFNELDWSYARHTPLAKWMLIRHPSLYNPDPYIFCWRTEPNAAGLREGNSPIIFFYHKQPKKVMVCKTQIDSLLNYGISKANIEKIKKTISYNFDWGYVDMNYFKSALGNEGVYMKVRERRIACARIKILQSEWWMGEIRRKASAWNMTFDEVLKLDSEYIVSEAEKNGDN